MTPEVAEALLELRRKHPLWGPKKLKAVLMRREPQQRWPALSTIGELLRRAGLTQEARQRRQRVPVATQPFAACTAPNVVWCADFKGKFRVGRTYCHPLTISDGYSRFLVRCQALEGEKLAPVRENFERAFREYGLPLRIRTDNGTPFASRGVAGLSRLSVWWVKLGIIPERIEPGKPQQNGRHERLHRTLKAHTERTASLDTQQIALDEFRAHYNNERPHEALQQRTPSDVYVPSTRSLSADPGDPEYPEEFLVRRVKSTGAFKFNTTLVPMGSVLGGEAIGCEPIADGRWQLWFGPIYLGVMTELAKGKVEVTLNKPAAQ
jgi:transposase InsO family protein